ncbi:deoxyribodipyrimidine photo-lyase [Aureimonas sp. SA4125]|uniref:cryptochrome/photolyase family protein n=1 Tax=Aureimonas sp. SA4125 TaxID=2826993 RepID=UPI001CC43B21|nr:deoxyribodipyrimidine photo-lyase [Aureimonas sp. SA4125]BDA83724.1 deoxyribodipyrimidine photo-lyase [Aureimonas sp. SA4125]
MTAPDSPEAGPILVWLRDDLRLDDNPVLAAACQTGRPVVILYVLESEGPRPLGGAHRWWLHHSLAAFSQAIEALGGRLVLRRGRAAEIVPAVLDEAGAMALWFNRRYEQDAVAVDDDIAAALDDIDVRRFGGHILHDPSAVKTKTGNTYRVYTPFWKSLSADGAPRAPVDAPTKIQGLSTNGPRSDDLAAWKLLPTRPDWSGGLAEAFEPGEAAAHARFDRFCAESLGDYDAGRERPAEDATSRMSPHLRFGEISPFRLWHRAHEVAARRDTPAGDLERFDKELVWRDFNYHLLTHFGPMASRNFDARFDAFPWRTAPEELKAWQEGRTGYPLVDAAMRQLWQTGWMHNRLRMVTASFLTKHLLIDWRDGEDWFWDTLVDGDPASNASQWQWVAGSGADAQPFFRIFNPITQSRKFDAAGVYIRRFVPELTKLSDRDIHAPWELDAATLAKAGVTLGETYPRPIVDHALARARALEAFKSLKD